MKKRYLSALLAFCFLLTLFPASALAAGEERPVAPLRQIDSGGCDYSALSSAYHAAIDANGDLWTWGTNNYGELGDGTTTARSATLKILDNVSGVSLGGYHSAAIKTDGSLWTWGRNNFGQLGDGTTTNRPAPMKILDNVSAVSLGGWHSAAIKTDGSLWMWGKNGDGQLGDGTTTDRSAPVKILDNVSAVSLGGVHSAAIKTDGSLWTWGWNDSGRLGDGTTTTRSTPVKIMDGVSAVSLGGGYSTAVKTDGSLWTWGWNDYGQLGDGTTTNRSKPVKILDDVFSVSSGVVHVAAVKTDGSLWMWGGTIRAYYSKTPVKIQDKVLSASAGHESGLFVADDESLWQYAVDGIPPSKTEIEVISPLPGIYLDNESLTLPVNATATLTTTIYPASNRNSALVWVSSDPDVATVENGLVTAKGAGEADITVMAAKTGDTAVCHVTVPAPLTLDKDAVTLRVGNTLRLTPTVSRADGEETGVAWFSTAPAVASVSEDGVVSALAGGTATVSVVTLDGAYKADCVVTVPKEVSGVWLDRDSVTMKPGDSVTLTATVVPEDAVEQDVRWISSAPGVATVSNGLVKAWSVGKTTVTAATASGGFTASCAVNVTESGAETPTYTITFDPNGGTVAQTRKTVTRGQPYGALPAPARTDYKFDGWFTAANGGTEITKDTTVNLSDAQTLYAHWTPALIVPGLAELTYSFGNSASGLGYPTPYRIPYERYKMIFGDTVAAQWYFKASGDWGGDCYGFSTTAAMFSQNGGGVSTDAFRSGATLPAQLRTDDKNAQLGVTTREFLEAMQVSQNAPLIQRAYQNNKNKLNELCAAADAYQKTGKNPVLVAVFGKQGGHALLAYKLEQNRLYVYDCNYPNTERYVTLMTDANGDYVGWYYRLNDAYDWGSAYKGSWISFVPYADFLSVWNDRERKFNASTELLTVNADVVLKDFNGAPIASLEDGELITMQPDIYPLVEIGLTSDGEAPNKDTVSIWIPVGIYDLERTGDYVRANGEITLMDAENPFEASVTHVDQSADVSTTADKFSFIVDDESELNRVMFYGAAAEGAYDVTFRSTLTGARQDARIVGNVSSQPLTFGMVNGQAVADEASMLSIEAYFLNGDRVDTKNVSGDTTVLVTFSPNGGSGSMPPRKVADDGQFTFPDCDFDAPSPERTFTGWMVDGVLYQPGKTVQLDADTSAVAQWSGVGIGDVTADGNDVTVRFFSAFKQSVSVAVCAYSDGGKMLASAVRTVNGAASANVTLNVTGAAYLKAFLLDPDANAPLCEPFRKDLK